MVDRWYWQIGVGRADRTTLLTQAPHGGNRVVLCAQGAKLMTRDPDLGVLVAITEEMEVAKRLALAPDHTKLASAFALGVLRYVPFAGSERSGELCVAGLRHATRLDEFGVPRMTDGVWEGIDQAWAAAHV